MIAIDWDIIGPLYLDDETAVPGWHVNTTGRGLAQRPELTSFVVTPEPARLRRVWAGDDPVDPILTIALRFSDEAEAIEAAG